MKLTEKKKIVSLALFFFIVFGLSICLMKPVNAHRMPQKYTKVKSGTYTIQYDYYNEKPWQTDDVTLKIGKKFVLIGRIENKAKGVAYDAWPLKLTFAKKCKFYNVDGETYDYKRISKKQAQKILKYTKGKCYITLEKFHVKKNKVDKVYLCWY